jgi:hypothetical protein
MMNFERERILGPVPFCVRHSIFGVRYSTFRDRRSRARGIAERPGTPAGGGFADTLNNVFAKKR